MDINTVCKNPTVYWTCINWRSVSKIKTLINPDQPVSIQVLQVLGKQGFEKSDISTCPQRSRKKMGSPLLTIISFRLTNFSRTFPGSVDDFLTLTAITVNKKYILETQCMYI